CQSLLEVVAVRVDAPAQRRVQAVHLVPKEVDVRVSGEELRAVHAIVTHRCSPFLPGGEAVRGPRSRAYDARALDVLGELIHSPAERLDPVTVHEIGGLERAGPSARRTA